MIDPRTNRRINKDDTNYVNLINLGFKDENNILVPPQNIIKNYIKLANNYILQEFYYNKNKIKSIYPDTGRSIQYATALKKSEFDFIYDNINLSFKIVPKNKTNYDKTNEGFWLKKGTKAYILAETNNKIIKKMVYAPNKNMIPIDSEQFAALIDSGYIYNEKKNLLIYPVHIHIADISYPVGASDLQFIIDSNINKITITFNSEMKEIALGSLTQIAASINKEIFYTEDKECQLQGIQGGTDVIFGIAFDGKKNCLISELEKHCLITNNYPDTKPILEKLYQTYKHGVFSARDYTEIGKKLKLQIHVSYPPFKDIIIFGKHRTRSDFHCRYNNNHIFTEYKEWDQKVLTEVDEIKWDDIDISKVINVLGDLKNPSEIEMTDTRIKAKYMKFEDKIIELGECLSPIGFYTNIFLKNNPSIKPISRFNANIDAIKSICQHGIMFDKSQSEKLHYYDIKKAYTTYEKCSYYSGFPTDLTYCINTEDYNPDQIKSLLQYEGFAFVKMICIWTGDLVERWVSFPYLRFYLSDRNDVITIFYCMLSREKTNLNLKELDVNKRIWHYILGNINSTQIRKSYITTDPLLATTTKGMVERHTITNKDNTEIFRKTISSEGVGNKYYPHISGYVQNYTEIRMEQFIIENNITRDSINRVWIDGIYTTKKIKLSNENINNWHYETSNINKNQIEEPIKLIYNAIVPVYFSYKFDERLISGDKILVKGSAGTGKSYLLKNLYNQIPNSIVLVPTNELKKQFLSCACETIDTVLVNYYKYKKYTTFLIDEYCLVSQEKIDDLYKKLDVKLLILFGDMEQLSLVCGTPIRETHNKLNVLELKKIYRQTNKEFQNKLNKLRKEGVFDFKNKIDPKGAINQKCLILSSTHTDISKLNKLGLNLNDNELVDGLKVGAPVRFYKTSKDFNAGELGVINKIGDGIITIKKEDGVLIKLKIDQFKKYHKLAYSMTYHAVQGKTINDQKIAINTNKLFDKNMKYVGCSRVIDEDQLYLLIGL